MSHKYIEDLHWIFGVSDEAKSLFEKIIKASTKERENILKDIDELRTDVGLSYALLALYRQQVNSGFVLADPLKTEGKKEKRFFDFNTDITFRLQWNPDRELRKNHPLLIERGVIAKNVDETKLINRDKNGKACYLCKTNIDEQFPGEILLEIDLADEQFYVGANFAYITNNHFTVMNAKHQDQQTQIPSQKYRKEIPTILNDFIDNTGGHFRAIFNGLAGASIEEHEHLQVTTEKFPIEEIKIEDKDVVYKSNDIRVSQPQKYYVPVWIVEGWDKTKIEIATDRIIGAWHRLNEQNHTENIISAKSGYLYRTFVILRDRNKLPGNKAGKKGPMAAFETGGNIVLSYEPKVNIKDINEKQTFDNASPEKVKQLLKEISPDEQSCSHLFKEITSTDMGISYDTDKSRDRRNSV